MLWHHQVPAATVLVPVVDQEEHPGTSQGMQSELLALALRVFVGQHKRLSAAFLKIRGHWRTVCQRQLLLQQFRA